MPKAVPSIPTTSQKIPVSKGTLNTILKQGRAVILFPVKNNPLSRAVLTIIGIFIFPADVGQLDEERDLQELISLKEAAHNQRISVSPNTEEESEDNNSCTKNNYSDMYDIPQSFGELCTGPTKNTSRKLEHLAYENFVRQNLPKMYNSGTQSVYLLTPKTLHINNGRGKEFDGFISDISVNKNRENALGSLGDLVDAKCWKLGPKGSSDPDVLAVFLKEKYTQTLISQLQSIKSSTTIKSLVWVLPSHEMVRKWEKILRENAANEFKKDGINFSLKVVLFEACHGTSSRQSTSN